MNQFYFTGAVLILITLLTAAYTAVGGIKAVIWTDVLQIAVLFGALITMVNFGNLAFAKHPGMVSMGLLLTIGLAMTLLCALVLLPSLLALRWKA